MLKCFCLLNDSFENVTDCLLCIDKSNNETVYKIIFYIAIISF